MADETHEVDYADSGRKSRDFGNDLKDIGQSTTEIINIDTTYQPNWGPAEGFRENYQNWKDGFVRSFEFSETSFKVECIDRAGERFFPVHHPEGEKPLLGYIRFTYDSKKLGVLEITNFKASLQRRHLGIDCRIQRVSKTSLREQQEIAAQSDEQGKEREARSRPWEDVSVINGEPRRCRSLLVEVQTSSKVPLAEFGVAFKGLSTSTSPRTWYTPSMAISYLIHVSETGYTFTD